MDVKCEKCGTEYEFDDAKVTESGITVKCTNCGHLFRVVRHRVVFDEQPLTPAGGSTPPPAGSAGRQWRIRTGGGEICEFKDLATLQQWIVQRKVERSDEISKTGDTWKPLGSIVELSSFFAAIDGETSGLQPPTPLVGPPLTPAPGPAPPLPASREELLDTGEFRLEGPEGRPSVRTRVAPQSRIVAVGYPAPPPSPSYSPDPALSRSSRALDMSVATPLPAPQAGLYPQSTPLSFEGELAGYSPPGHASTRGFFVGVLATVAVAGLAYFVWDQTVRGQSGARGRAERSHVGARPSHAELVASLDAAEAATRRDTMRAFAEAEKIFNHVLAEVGEPPSDADLAIRAKLGMARIAVIRAEYRRLEGKDTAGQLEKALLLLAGARSLTGQSSEQGAGGRLGLGFADYYRVAGQPEQMARHLDAAAERGAPRAEIEFERAAAGLYDKRVAPSVVADKLNALSMAARKEPRAQYVRAVALRRAGRHDEATQALVELVAGNKGHGPGIRLLEALGATDQEPKAVEVKPSPVAVADPPAPPPKAPAPPPKLAAKSSRAGYSTAGASYDSLLNRGYRLLERGKTRKARRFFEAAAHKRGGSPEPWANLGWCDLDAGQSRAAIAHFQKSLSRSARYADGLYGLAVAYEKAGRKAEAISTYQRYLKVHPRGRKAGMVQRKLDRLR